MHSFPFASGDPLQPPPMFDLHHRQYRQAERLANIGSWRFTIATRRVDWSDQVFVIHGLPVGTPPPLERALDFYPVAARALIAEALDRTIATGAPFDLETDINVVGGATRRVHIVGELELAMGQPHAVIGVFQDITTRYQLEQALRRSASLDGLTAIANRSTFNAELDARIVAARASAAPLALLIIDLDDFKQVNDGHGHLVGDEVLRFAARQLEAAYLSDCFVARLGGDEFAVIVSTPEDCGRLDAIVANLVGSLRATPTVGTALIGLSATIGVGWLDNGDARDDLIRRADAALYAAKRSRVPTRPMLVAGTSYR